MGNTRTLSRLSTIDNPYDPFDQYSEWYNWDIVAGYNSCSLLDRIAVTSTDLSLANQDEAIERAIDEIVMENVTGVFIKVTKVIDDDSESVARKLIAQESS